MIQAGATLFPQKGLVSTGFPPLLHSELYFRKSEARTSY